MWNFLRDVSWLSQSLGNKMKVKQNALIFGHSHLWKSKNVTALLLDFSIFIYFLNLNILLENVKNSIFYVLCQMETYKVPYFKTFNRKTILQEKKLTKKCMFRLISGFEQVVLKYANFKFQNLNYLTIFEDVLQTFSFLQHKKITKQFNLDWKSSTIWNKKVRA